MIKKITLDYFKAFQHAEIEIKPLTILVGPNNGGKTSLLHSILLIKQTLDMNGQEILKLNSDVNFGEFENIVNQESDQKEIRLKFDFEEYDRFLDVTFTKEDDNLIVKNFSCNTGELEYTLVNTKMIKQGSEIRCYPENYWIKSKYRNIDEDLIRDINPAFQGNSFLITPQIPPENFDLLSQYLLSIEEDMRMNRSLYYHKDLEKGELSFKNNVRSIQLLTSLMKYTSQFNNIIREEFNDILYLGPIRNTAERSYNQGHYNHVGFKGENTAPIIEESPNYIKKGLINILKRLDIAKSIETVNINKKSFELKLLTDNTISPVNFADVGCGTSQILPIIVQLLIPRINSMLIFEQPETHLHPKVQAELASLLVDLLKGKIGFLPEKPIDPDGLSASKLKNKTKYLIETHSDYFIERIRYHIAKGDISTDDVFIYYIEPDEVKRGSKPIKIQINSKGQYYNIPQGYSTNFRMKETKNMTDILLKNLSENE